MLSRETYTVSFVTSALGSTEASVLQTYVEARREQVTCTLRLHVAFIWPAVPSARWP